MRDDHGNGIDIAGSALAEFIISRLLNRALAEDPVSTPLLFNRGKDLSHGCSLRPKRGVVRAAGNITTRFWRASVRWQTRRAPELAHDRRKRAPIGADREYARPHWRS